MKQLMVLALGCMGLQAEAQEVQNTPIPADKRIYIIESCSGLLSYPNTNSRANEWRPNQDNPTSMVLDRTAIMSMAAINLRDIVALAPCVYQRQRGANVQMSGGRELETLYVVDGMQIAR